MCVVLGTESETKSSWIGFSLNIKDQTDKIS